VTRPRVRVPATGSVRDAFRVRRVERRRGARDRLGGGRQVVARLAADRIVAGRRRRFRLDARLARTRTLGTDRRLRFRAWVSRVLRVARLTR
jgi:hypothetical protein